MGESNLGNDSFGGLIGLFFIVLVIVILGRPWFIKLFYKLLYEPDAKVEDYPVTSRISFDDKGLKVLDYYEERKELEENDSSFIKQDGFNHQITRSVDESPRNLKMEKTHSKSSVVLERSSIAKVN